MQLRKTMHDLRHYIRGAVLFVGGYGALFIADAATRYHPPLSSVNFDNIGTCAQLQSLADIYGKDALIAHARASGRSEWEIDRAIEFCFPAPQPKTRRR